MGSRRPEVRDHDRRDPQDRFGDPAAANAVRYRDLVIRDGRIISLGWLVGERRWIVVHGTYYGRKVEYAGRRAKVRSGEPRRIDPRVATFRDCGRMLRRGVGVRVPALPTLEALPHSPSARSRSQRGCPGAPIQSLAAR